MATDYTGLLTAGANAIGTGIAANNVANSQSSLAQQQLNLGQQAANAAQFRPVGVTSRFGTSGFQYDQNGNLIGAGYQVAPDIAAMREALLSLAGQNITNAGQAQGLFNNAITGANSLYKLGQQYVAQSPQAAAQNWLNQQQQLLAPGREQQLAQLTNQQFQQGRGGLAVGATRQGYTTSPQGQQQYMPQQQSFASNPLSSGFPQDQSAVSPYVMGQPQSQANNPYGSDNFGGPGYVNDAFEGVSPTSLDTGTVQGWNPGMDVGAPSFLPTQGNTFPPTAGGYVNDAFEGVSPTSLDTGTVQGWNQRGGQSFMPSVLPTQGSQGLAATNPQMAAYYNSLALQDATLAAQAQQQGQAQTTFGQGLMTGGLGLAGSGYGLQSTALQPYSTALSGAATTEALGQNPFDLSTALGAKQATAGSQVASILNQAANQAAGTQQTGLTAKNAAITGAISGGVDAVNALLKSWAGTPTQGITNTATGYDLSQFY